MVSYQSQATHSKQPQNENRVAVLLAGYGEVQSYRELSHYEQAASKYIASQFIPIPKWLYPTAGRLLALQDWYNFGINHDHFLSPENEIFEKQRLGIEAQLKEHWGNRVEVFKGFYFCQPFLQQVVEDIIQQGFQNLLIYPLLVVDSAFTGKIAVEQVNEVIVSSAMKNDSQHPIFEAIRYIPGFATEPAYVNLLVNQLKAELSVSQFSTSQIGIVLTVHGAPEKTKGLLTGVIDGQALYDQVKAKLQNQYPLISIGWVNHDTPFIHWTQPNQRQAAENLIKAGAQVILFKPLGWATENYETILDTEDVVQSLQAHHPAVVYKRLNCVNDDPDFLKIAAEWANPYIETMLSGSKQNKSDASSVLDVSLTS
jgi:protoporphyrin/coproporphyrin ferrochelatase